MKDLKSLVNDVLSGHPLVLNNVARSEMIRASVEHREAMVTASGALATWTAPESTGRSPKDTYMVKRSISEANIDWNSPNNLPIDEDTFDLIFSDALEFLKGTDRLYETDRVIGADSKYALPVKVLTYRALHTLFIDNMFRPVPEDIRKSCYADDGFTLLALPYHKLDSEKYAGKLRKLPNGKTSDLIVAMDFDRKVGMVIGSAYMGSMKKMLFTVMNYLLPLKGILPLHCSANEGQNGDSALLLGLSGTGKTTLSADPTRALLGDDEHGWGEDGIANFEFGCYAKMIDINPKKEPDIYDAVMRKVDYLNHGSMVENAMIYPDGTFDFYDNRFTENSRASFPLSYLRNIKESSVAVHPSTILFLTADAYGVLPPVAKLTKEQAMLWFMMGYTSKLAGTETGITEPQVAFSRFFGAPFMPCNPDVYAGMLGKKLDQFKTRVFLINTGWSGGGYGVGKRIDLTLTRQMVNAALSGRLDSVDYIQDSLFHVHIPKSCPGVPSEMLNPVNTWTDTEAYKKAAEKLAKQFSDHFDKAYGNKNLPADIVWECPGK
ncbi:MAG: phosphoenolpyruvate carboxykinase (ATP) [Bacteroidetes bacterium GWF2_49_14]|nr:MAG: phosphoenolpyruvate carboxykinase (ATP) [Bacteroidetes bacterium GWF2_49_14]